MLKNKNVLKILFTILLVLIPWSLNSSVTNEVVTPVLNTESLSFYQKITMTLS